jgi:hypothetical protein
VDPHGVRVRLCGRFTESDAAGDAAVVVGASVVVVVVISG